MDPVRIITRGTAGLNTPNNKRVVTFQGTRKFQCDSKLKPVPLWEALVRHCTGETSDCTDTNEG